MNIKKRLEKVETDLGINKAEQKKLNTPTFDAYYETLSEADKAIFDGFPKTDDEKEYKAWIDRMSEEMRYQYGFGLFEGWFLNYIPDFYNLENADRIRLAKTSKVLMKHVPTWHHSEEFAYNRGDLICLYEGLSQEQILGLMDDFYYARK